MVSVVWRECSVVKVLGSESGERGLCGEIRESGEKLLYSHA